MRLRHIEVFHAVHTCGSITGAAKLLSVSQPSVSKVLAHAEQQLGFMLFERRKGKMVPTREADRLIEHVTDTYKNINSLRRVAKNLGAAETGVIRIAMTPALGIDLLPAAIASYLDLHPDTTFEIEGLHSQQVVRALKEMRMDFGIVFGPAPTPGIMIDHLINAEFVVITHHSLDFGSRTKLTLEDLDGMPFVNLGARSPLGQLLADRIETSNIQPRTVANVETYQMAKALVAHGAGVALVDEITARSSGHKKVIARHLDPPLQFEVAILHAESDPFSIINQQFINHLKNEIRKFLSVPLVNNA